MSQPDAFALAQRYAKFLRVTDVVDGLDAVGRGGHCLLDRSIRPLWMGMHFFGPAVTMRVLPTQRPMPPIKREDALRQHAIWGEMGGWRTSVDAHLKPGCVVVSSTGGAPECGYWGSNNSMDMQARGAVGIVTEGYCRDTEEVIMQKSPVACSAIGRPIIPGRTELHDVQVPISCGGCMIRPGDIIGCDWDGTIVIPLDVAEDVLVVAARISVDDRKGRRRLYEKLGKPVDDSVDWEGAAEWFKDLL